MKITENFLKTGVLNLSGFGSIFGNCPDGIVLKNEVFEYLIVNSSYCKIFNISERDKIIGGTVNEFLSEENRKFINDADIEVKSNLLPCDYVINTSENKVLSITTSPILNGNKFCGLTSIVRDITQEEVIKEKFVSKHFEYINKEKQLQSQRETFVASIGHDLKNPTLAQIRGLELLLKGAFGKFSVEQREILEMVLDSCRYMNGMLSSLLATYRNYAGAVKLDFEEFNFMTLLSECVSEMLYVAKDKGINITTQAPDSELTVCADKVQIKRVIMNLLSNGIKYAYKDTELKLTVKKSGDNLIFSFENRSPYINEDKQKSIFARYVSYTGINKELGTGLGLYSSKKIIECHDGKIYVKSFKDDRNIFGFTIPVKQPENSDVHLCF